MKIFLFFSGRQLKLQGRHEKTGSVGLAETQVFFRPNHFTLFTQKAHRISIFGAVGVLWSYVVQDTGVPCHMMILKIKPGLQWGFKLLYYPGHVCINVIKFSVDGHKHFHFRPNPLDLEGLGYI